MPKGVMLSSRNILTNIMQGASRMQLNADDRAYMPLPLFHSFAQNTVVWGVFFFGLSAIIIPKLERRYLLQGFAHKPTIVFAVPALYALFCMIRNFPYESVRYFVSGGDALPDKIRSIFAVLFGRMICNGYGLTETCPMIAAQVEEGYVGTDVVGAPLYGINCSIRSTDGTPVGVLWVKGDNVMMGYYNAPQATAECLHDGWFNTGDLAYQDKEGRLHIVGREKDLIISKGFNIYPQEIENVLLSHPAVQQAAVVGIADENGELPIAWVVVKSADQDEKSLKKWCSEHIAPYKVPHKFIICESLPLTSLGKINKKALKAEYANK
jgi:long-chain acyl-CoA synthetase